MSARARRVIVALNQSVERVVVRLTLEVTANLTEATPVDTGWARANWVPRIGGPAGSASPDSGVPSRQAEQQAAIAEVAVNYQLPAQVHIANHVDYVPILNEGSSSQAPEGFVERAIDLAIAAVGGRA